MHDPRLTASFQSTRPILLSALMALGLLGAAACKSTSEAAAPAQAPAQQRSGRAEISNEATATAAVVTVDPKTRTVTLRREDGSLFSVEASSAVRNFDQIAAGDTLRVRYKESLSAMVLPAGEILTPPEGALAASRAKVGEKPAGGVGANASVRVKIESVDAASGIVVFSPYWGELRTVRAARPEGREFVKGLKVGDLVQIDYAVTLALSIEKL